MLTKNTKVFIKWVYVVLASILFVAFQNFTSPIKVLDNEYISIEKLANNEFRLVFEKGRAEAIMAKLIKADGIVKQKLVIDSQGKRRKVSVIIYRGESLSCSIQPQGLQTKYCWTVLTKDGTFRADDKEPDHLHNSYLPISMPVYNAHLGVEQDVLDFLENHKAAELPSFGKLEVHLKLENSFFRMHNLKFAKLVDSEKNMSLRCSPAPIDFKHLCSFTISSTGKIEPNTF